MSFELKLQELLKNRTVSPESCPVLSKKEQEKEEFREQFSDITLSVIKPTLIKIQKLLKQEGEQALVQEIPYTFGPNGREHLASVSLYVQATHDMDKVQLHRCPHVSFLCDPCNKKVRSHKNTMAPHHGGTSYTTGAFALDEIEATVIEDKVLDVLKDVYK